jgi:hypothetical protein
MMTTLTNMITDIMEGNALPQISQAIGTDEASAGRGIAAAVPTLVSALAGKASQPEGATSLLQMFTQRGDSSILDNLGGYLSNPQSAGGAGLLNTLLGNEQSATEAKLARLSGLSQGAVGRLLPILAPIVMGAAGKVVQTQGLNASGLTSYLSDQQGYLRSSAPGLLGFLEKIDANDDGSIMDDLSRLFGGLFHRG